MPTLSWSSKSESIPMEGNLITEGILYPFGGDTQNIQVNNRLVLGDNLRVMNALLNEYELEGVKIPVNLMSGRLQKDTQINGMI